MFCLRLPHMKTKITAFSIFATFFILSGLHAQSYNSAFGLRMGTDWGLSLKQRIEKRITVEAILQSSLQREEVIITLLLEKHLNLLTRHLNFYWGAGFHKGWIDDVYLDFAPKDPFGISFIGGAEFSIGRINLTYDFKPVLNLQGGEKRFYNQTGITARYILQKRSKLIWEKNNKKSKRKRKANHNDKIKKNSKLNKNSSWLFWSN